MEIDYEKAQCPKEVSEMKTSFQQPKLKKPTATRSQLYEQFLWQEIFDEYLRYNYRLGNVKIEPEQSEYYHAFCKNMPKKDDEELKEALLARYPLYNTVPITCYNPKGDTKKDFKKRYLITRPVSEQKEQFG